MVADTTLAPVQNTFKDIWTDADMMITWGLDRTFISGCKVFPRVARYSESATSGQGVIRHSEWLKKIGKTPVALSKCPVKLSNCVRSMISHGPELHWYCRRDPELLAWHWCWAEWKMKKLPAESILARSSSWMTPKKKTAAPGTAREEQYSTGQRSIFGRCNASCKLFVT